MLFHVSPAYCGFLKAGLVLPSQLFTLDFLLICISEAFTEIHVYKPFICFQLFIQ